MEYMRYKEHHICINIGSQRAKLRISSDACPFEGIIHRGQFLITPATQLVNWHLMDKAQALSIGLEPKFVEDIAAAMEMKPDKELILSSVAVSNRNIWIYGQQLMEELESGDVGGCLIAGSLARLLAAHLLRNYTRRPPRNRIRRNSYSNTKNDYILKVKEILDDGMRTDYGRIELAKLVHKSGNQLDVQFKKRFGVTMLEYQRHRRVELAKGMLREGYLPAEVSYQLGYCHVNHFYNQFKRYVHCTPAEFQKSPF
jgi:AraC-like DNA-binding protein